MKLLGRLTDLAGDLPWIIAAPVLIAAFFATVVGLAIALTGSLSWFVVFIVGAAVWLFVTAGKLNKP